MSSHSLAIQNKNNSNGTVRGLVNQLKNTMPNKLIIASTSNVAKKIIRKEPAVISLINMGDKIIPDLLDETIFSNSDLRYEVHLAVIYILGELRSYKALEGIVRDVERTGEMELFYLDFYVVALKKILREKQEKYCGYREKDLERLIKQAKKLIDQRKD